MIEDKNVSVAKYVKIEKWSWDKAKEIIAKDKLERKLNARSMKELVSMLLIEHQKGLKTIEPYKREEAIIRKIELNKDALEYFLNDKLEGGRTYLINGLIRTWLKENS